MQTDVTVNINVRRHKGRMTFTMTTPAAPMMMEFVTQDPTFLRKLRDEINAALVWAEQPKGS